jgi:hypothetical protein
MGGGFVDTLKGVQKEEGTSVVPDRFSCVPAAWGISPSREFLGVPL